MNTVKKGDQFEKRSYDLIKKTIESGQLGLIANQCQVFSKKGYFSKQRNSEIFFDLTIEVWPPGAKRATLIYIIECKSLSKKVPVDDIEEFQSKINQVSELNTKGVFITDIGYQKSAYSSSESLGLMLIQLNYDESYKIILHKISRDFKQDKDSWDELIKNLLVQSFNLNTKITGLKKLSSEQIESITKDILNDFSLEIINNIKPVPILNFIKYCKEKFGIDTDTTWDLGINSTGQNILGLYSKSEKKIYIDRSLVDSVRLAFVFSHELGHAILHDDLKINQQEYDAFRDSEYNYKLDKHQLENEKNWIEWQANHFAITLILPITPLLGRLIWFQDKNGIPHKGRIYVDDQRINQLDFQRTISFLSNYFKVTKTSVIYRLKEIGVLTFNYSHKQIARIIFDD